uniref:Uncharacterized protein n=1 Tax=Schizaphis graminum TaxID=13262 RepID=A0A2S2PKC5_SCHGA
MEYGEQPDGNKQPNDTKPERSLCHLPTVCGKLRRYPCVVVERSATAGDHSVGATLKGTKSGVPREHGTALPRIYLCILYYIIMCVSHPFSLNTHVVPRSLPSDAKLDSTSVPLA